MKKNISIVMSLIMMLGIVFTNTIPAKAYVMYCSGSVIGGRHDMLALGRGIVRVNGVTIFSNGSAYQCQACKEVIVTENNAVETSGETVGPLGRYATWNPGFWMSLGTATVNVSHINTTSSTSIEGYRFRNRDYN